MVVRLPDDLDDSKENIVELEYRCFTTNYQALLQEKVEEYLNGSDKFNSYIHKRTRCETRHRIENDDGESVFAGGYTHCTSIVALRKV